MSGTKGWTRNDIAELDKKRGTDVLATQVFNAKDFGDPKIPDGQITLPDAPKRLKYGNKKVQIDGIWFDSKREGKRYGELKLLEKAGEIIHLELQKKYDFIFNEVKICSYVCDFYYKKVHKAWDEEIIEDVKGIKTATYRIKKRMMKAFYNIEVLET